MKGDFSRRTFDPGKQYSAVLQEQGRMLTDADLEEEHRILADRIEKGIVDLIGGCGGPIGDAGFEITLSDGDLAIGQGTYCVDGIWVRNPEDEDGQVDTLTDQPYHHGAFWPPEGPGWYHIYLDVWRRLVTALDDPAIREVALGGPTTAAREQTVWQVKAVRDELGEAEGREPNCLDPLPPLGETTGRLGAQADLEASTSDPCEVPPAAGFKGLENQFYRVEVHESGSSYDLDTPIDVAEITAFSSEAPNELIVDSAFGLVAGSAVEVYAESAPEEGTFAYVVGIDGTTITLSANVTGFSIDDAPRLRRVDATYVWSRDNGSVVTTIERIDGTEITVRDLGRDAVLGFSSGQWVEIADDTNEFEGRPGQLRQIASVDMARRTMVLVTTAEQLEPGAPDGSGVAPDRHPKLRRWDGAGAILHSDADQLWLPLEDGIQVRFTNGTYRTGDWWHVAARTATIDPNLGNIEWPVDVAGEAALLEPHGVMHHTCPLALVHVATSNDTLNVDRIVDCRNLFPPVTELTTLLYVGGDGQEGMPDPSDADALVTLEAPLQVRVANGSHPVEGAVVEFAITGAGGRVNGSSDPAEAVTDEHGLATCTWDLDGGQDTQICEAHLHNAAGEAIEHQVVRFHASLSRADRVSYDPNVANCDDLRDATTVQDAIDILCRRTGSEGGRCCCMSVGRGGQFEDLATAFGVLLEQGETDICLCLLPGDHELAGLTIDDSEAERSVSLSIAGCGDGTRLHLRRPIRLDGLREFALRRLDIGALRSSSIEARQCRTVNIDECRISGTGGQTGLIRIEAASRVHVGNCTLEALVPNGLEEVSGFFRELGQAAGEMLGELYAAMSLLEEFEPRAREITITLSQMSRDERSRFGGTILDRISEMEGSLSMGEATAYRLLAETLVGREVQRWEVFDKLLDLRFAAGRAGTTVALEINNLVREREESFSAAGARGGAVVLENNVIVGFVSFYGPAHPGRDLPVEILMRLRELLQGDDVQLGAAGLSVHVRDNHLTRLVIGGEFAEEIERWTGGEGSAMDNLLTSFHCTDNIVDGVVSVIVARHVSLAHNEFTLAAVRNVERQNRQQRVADVIGDSAVYTGNHAQRRGFGVSFAGSISDITRISAEAANLEIQIAP